MSSKIRMQIWSGEVAEGAEVDRPVNPADMGNRGFTVNAAFSNKGKRSFFNKPKNRKKKK